MKRFSHSSPVKVLLPGVLFTDDPAGHELQPHEPEPSLWVTPRAGHELVVQWSFPERWFDAQSARSHDGCLWVVLEGVASAGLPIKERAIWEARASWFVNLPRNMEYCRAVLEVRTRSGPVRLLESESLRFIAMVEAVPDPDPVVAMVVMVPERNVSESVPPGIQGTELHPAPVTGLEERNSNTGDAIRSMEETGEPVVPSDKTPVEGSVHRAVTARLWALVEPYMDEHGSSWEG